MQSGPRTVQKSNVTLRTEPSSTLDAELITCLAAHRTVPAVGHGRACAAPKAMDVARAQPQCAASRRFVRVRAAAALGGEVSLTQEEGADGGAHAPLWARDAVRRRAGPAVLCAWCVRKPEVVCAWWGCGILTVACRYRKDLGAASRICQLSIQSSTSPCCLCCLCCLCNKLQEYVSYLYIQSSSSLCTTAVASTARHFERQQNTAFSPRSSSGVAVGTRFVLILHSTNSEARSRLEAGRCSALSHCHALPTSGGAAAAVVVASSSAI